MMTAVLHLVRSCFPVSLAVSMLVHGGLFLWAWLYWASTELPALYAPTPGRCSIGLLASVAPTPVETTVEPPPPVLPVLTQISMPIPDLPPVPTREITEKLIDLKNKATEHAVKKLAELKAKQPKKEKRETQPEAVDSPGSVASDGAQVDEHPTLYYQRPPRYPPQLLASGIEGRVIVRVLVRADGTVASARLQESSGWKEMDEAALEAIRNWRFRPARRGNSAVSCEADQPVRFYIR